MNREEQAIADLIAARAELTLLAANNRLTPLDHARIYSLAYFLAEAAIQRVFDDES